MTMTFPTLDFTHRGISATFDGQTLTWQDSGLIRKWTLTDQGLATTLLQDYVSQHTYVDAPQNTTPDWGLACLSDQHSPSTLIDIEHRIMPATTARGEHVQVDVLFAIESQRLELRYRITGYPGVAGLRTQLGLKRMTNSQDVSYPHWLTEAYTEHLALDTNQYTRIAAGYYTDTQHRYHRDLAFLKEETHTNTITRCNVIDWANLLACEIPQGQGLVLLKESHKCVNQSGIDTGHFKLTPNCLISTGLGLRTHYAEGMAYCNEDDFRDAWATWCLPYSGGDTGRQHAVKSFDKAHFAFYGPRDGIITSNTWGSRGAGHRSQAAANEVDMLEEIKRAGELGIDCVQIDDGWQIEPGQSPYEPPNGWGPAPSRFPNGWDTVKQAANDAGVKLGIWFPWYAPLDQMLAVITDGGFTQVKLDFFTANTRKELDEFYQKAQAISALDDTIQIHADLTELSPRFGYYYGRDVCTLFPQNIEMCQEDNLGPYSITYTPEISLRQTWHYAKYMNLNQLQVSIQNGDMIKPDFSDAGQHPHDYCFAIAMMGLPLFFLETKFYSDEAMTQLKPAIALYRQHRDALLQGTVYPIGEEPNNASITGFLNISPGGKSGYILAMRERLAPEQSSIKVHAFKDKSVRLRDVSDNHSKDTILMNQENVPVNLPTSASWQLLHYEIV